ncbi:MAG: pentapeptide repeat-containing protein, partial [Verrucomicrobiota bacterium]
DHEPGVDHVEGVHYPDVYVFEFLMAQIALAFADKALAERDQQIFAELFVLAVEKGTPIQGEFPAVLQRANNAEESLLAALHGLHRVTQKLSDTQWSKVTESEALGNWIHRVRGQCIKHLFGYVGGGRYIVRRETNEVVLLGLGGLNFLHVLCVSQDLSGANLSWAKMVGANLNGVNLDGANLISVNLDGAILQRASLVMANLFNANLLLANLDGAILVGANLDGANLTSAILHRAILVTAHLVRANLYKARLDGAQMDGANLTEVNLNGAHLEEACLEGARLTGAILNEANLNRANLNDADLDGANLNGARLNKNQLSKTQLKQIKGTPNWLPEEEE